MLDMLGRGYIRAGIWLKCKVEDIKEGEVGVSGIVAAIVLVVITLILVGFFWKKIAKLVGEWFGKMNTESQGINNTQIPNASN